MDDSDNLIYCTLCTHTVKKDRKDNFDRHMKTHYGLLVTCDCGKEMAGTSLQRHKNNYCPLRKGKQLQPLKKKQQKLFMCECGAKMVKTSFLRHRKSACPKTNSSSSETALVTSPPYQSNLLVRSTTHKIETIVRTDVYSNGKVVVRHDEINSGNMCFTINASFQNKQGKIDS